MSAAGQSQERSLKKRDAPVDSLPIYVTEKIAQELKEPIGYCAIFESTHNANFSQIHAFTSSFAFARISFISRASAC